MKKITYLMFLSLLMVLVACSGNDTSSSEDSSSEASDGKLSGEVTFWTASLAGEPFDGYFENIKTEFEALHEDVTVTIQDTPQTEIEQRVLTALSGSDGPDVVNLNPHYMSNIASRGGLLDLESYVSEDYESTYVSGALESGRLDGTLYALPWYLTTTVSWYNKAHFDLAGIESLPTSSEEVYEVAKNITAQTGKPSFFQIVNDGNVIMEKMVTLAGGENIVESGVANFNENAEIVSYFTTMRDMYADGLISQRNAEGSIGAAQELFMSEDISFVEGGITFLGAVENGAPNVYEQAVAGKPIAKEGSPMNIAAMNLAVPANSENKEAAVAFMEFVLNAENQLEFSKIAGTVLPSTVASLEDPFFTDPGDSPKATGLKEGALALESSEVLIPSTDNNNELRESTLETFVNVMIGELDPQEGLDALANTWTESFSKAGLEISF